MVLLPPSDVVIVVANEVESVLWCPPALSVVLLPLSDVVVPESASEELVVCPTCA